MVQTATVLQNTSVLPRSISSTSTWDDDIWRFDLTRPGVTDSSRTIGWTFELPDGSRFSDPTWTALRETVKCFLWSLRTDPPAGKRRLGPGSLISIFNQIRVLICWMVSERYDCFGQLDASAAGRFMTTLRERPGRKGEALSLATRAGYLSMLSRLHAQREKLIDGVPNDLRRFLDEHGPRLPRLDRQERGFPYTPDPVATALIGGALRLIGTPADDVIALRDSAAVAYAYRIDGKRPTPGDEGQAHRMLDDFTFSTLPNEDSPWHAPVVQLKGIHALIERIYDACFVVIAWLVGARVSEILGLEAGCIERHIGPDGQQVTYLHGRIYKMATGDGGQPHRWIAPEPVVRVIDVLERLSAPIRKKLGTDNLWMLTRDPTLLRQPIGIPHSGAFGGRLNSSFRTMLDLPLHQGKPWHLNAHQGRKTFARFIGKRDRTGLHALQEHLGHVSRVMTDTAYVGTDYELAELINDEILKETRAALEDLLTASNLSGHAGRMIASRSPFRGRTHDGDLGEYIDFIVKDSGMVLGVCDWGYCLYRREHSACQGDDHGPNAVLRTQSVCARCANFAVSERHRAVWEDRKVRNAQLLRHPALDDESRELAQERILECDRILRGLAGESDSVR
ncbi:integrase [Mesorhizobium sp. NZP2077]|uniref:integrase n=2 Tax=Mesorhizobium sp. NZP2077 TaxID=2483404 RepID=UPI0015568EB4|nr:integrase [Mesorhizobium sp. NZP2077]QKC86739.1 integrase [Mesorhizobium sp. NZP2077]QKD20435.1 integrase [Mesorhizobium sp. NZP2077]